MRSFLSVETKQSEEKNRKQSDRPWIFKHQPNYENLCGNKSVIKILKKSLLNNSFPHLLFYGPSGTGKTSTIHAAINSIYSPSEISECVVWFNNIVYTSGKLREKISLFCKKNSTDKLKLVIFDEADILSQESQNLLRRNIEIYSQKTRFCFLCNYIDKIIPAIQSRCVLIHFKRLDFLQLENYLINIVRNESMTYDSKLLKEVYTICQGDCRQIINYLQKLHYLNMLVIDTSQVDFIALTMEEIDTRILDKSLLSISLYTYAKELNSRCCSSKQCLQYVLDKAKQDSGGKYIELFKNASTLLYKIKTGCNPSLIKLNILMYYCHHYFGYE